MHAKSHVVASPAPMDSPHYVYSELPPPPPSSYAAYAYAPAASSIHHADYPPYYVELDRPARCTCGDRRCTAQYPLHDVYDVGGRQHQYHAGHHVALPPGPPYPGHHQMVYPAEHFQIVRPQPPGHYLHHRHGGYPAPPALSSPAHFVPAPHGDGPRPIAPVGRRDHVTVTTATSDAASSAGDVTRDKIDNVEPPVSALGGTSTTTLNTAEHDITPTRDTGASSSSALAAAINTTTEHYAYSSGNSFSSVVIVDTSALLIGINGRL